MKNLLSAALIVALAGTVAFSQGTKPRKTDQRVRTVTIPVTFVTKEELREGQPSEFIEAGTILVKEDDQPQTILSIRSVVQTPLHLAVLIQDDLAIGFNNQLRDIAKFIRSLPPESRVMVAYLRPGSIQVRQKFTDNLEKAASSLRIVSGGDSSPRSPYSAVEDALERFDALPTGRRAILLVSDGVDVSEAMQRLPAGWSVDLENAILKAQRRGVAVYSFYNAGPLTAGGNSRLVLFGQSSLNRLSEETGGKAFFQGTFSPISFDPFFRELNLLLRRQFALTYLSTNMQKGFHKVDVLSTNPELSVEHPAGYYFRGL